MDLSQLIGAAHAMEILFVFGSFDSYIIKNFLFGEGAYPAGKKLSDHIQSYWAEFAYMEVLEKVAIMIYQNGKPGHPIEKNILFWTLIMIKGLYVHRGVHTRVSAG